jgi:phosphotransferase system enzyme I (PtsI)
MKEEKEFRLQGAPVSEGIAIGTSFFISPQTDDLIEEFSIHGAQVESEIARYRKALASCKVELSYLKQNLENEGSIDAVDIIDTHIQMLEDPLIKEHVEEKIRLVQRNTESVFSAVIR